MLCDYANVRTLHTFTLHVVNLTNKLNGVLNMSFPIFPTLCQLSPTTLYSMGQEVERIKETNIHNSFLSCRKEFPYYVNITSVFKNKKKGLRSAQL